ncbi:MAG: hypothetical protein ACKPKO_03170, partial [Candidatus Fonsibacter sp.]
AMEYWDHFKMFQPLVDDGWKEQSPKENTCEHVEYKKELHGVSYFPGGCAPGAGGCARADPVPGIPSPCSKFRMI